MPLKSQDDDTDGTNQSTAEGQQGNNLAYFFPNTDTESVTAVEAYPWLRQDYDASQESQLCDKCRRIDFLFLVTQGPSQYPICLGTVADARARAGTCSFCALILSNTRADQRISKREVMPDSATVLLSSAATKASDFGWSVRRGATEPDTYICIEVSFKSGGIVPATWRLCRIIPSLASEGTAAPDVGYFASRNVTPMYEPALVRGWLSDCSEFEPHVPSADVANFIARFIDCEEYKLVEAKTRFGDGEHIGFAALSYVWGKAGQQQTLTRQTAAVLFQAGGLSPSSNHGCKLSKTIQDAIQACRDLSVRYLWVDALCIYQDDDGPEKMAQIKNLHRIYENATFTIIGAEGDGASHGLSGVSYVPKQGSRQWSVTAQALRMVTAPSELTRVLQSSVWHTRAWTFQEFLLSKRALVFTDSGIFFSCPHGVRSEPVYNPPHACELDFDFSALEGLRYEARTETNLLNWAIYAELASSYSTRLLTNIADRIPAFLALSETLRRDLFLDTPFIWGLPTADLEAALLWRRCLGCIDCANPPSGLTRESKAGPSWSWAGWSGHVHYSDYVLGNERNPAASIIPVARFKEPVLHVGDMLLLADSTDNSPMVRAEPLGVVDPGALDTDPLANWNEHRTGGFTSPRGPTNALYTHPFNEIRLRQRNWLLKDRLLVVDTELASFAIAGRIHGDIKMQEYHPQLYNDHFKALAFGQSIGNPLGVYDLKTGNLCGALFDDFDYELPRAQGGLGSKLPAVVTFIKLSVAAVGDDAPKYHWRAGIGNFGSVGDMMRGLRGERSHGQGKARAPFLRHFDHDAYDTTRRWCMYNVLLVALIGDGGQIAHRLGVGKIHVDAFDHAADLTRRTVLLG